MWNNIKLKKLGFVVFVENQIQLVKTVELKIETRVNIHLLTKSLHHSFHHFIINFCFACAEHLCNLLGRPRRAHWEQTRNGSPPGPSQWTNKLLKCIFSHIGSRHLTISNRFSLLLLHPPLLQCAGDMWPYSTLCLKLHTGPGTASLLTCKTATHALFYGSSVICYSLTQMCFKSHLLLQ